jgi:hypothetical protein
MDSQEELLAELKMALGGNLLTLEDEIAVVVAPMLLGITRESALCAEAWDIWKISTNHRKQERLSQFLKYTELNTRCHIDEYRLLKDFIEVISLMKAK